jgi:hypothetical protein
VLADVKRELLVDVNLLPSTVVVMCPFNDTSDVNCVLPPILITPPLIFTIPPLIPTTPELDICVDALFNIVSPVLPMFHPVPDNELANAAEPFIFIAPVVVNPFNCVGPLKSVVPVNAVVPFNETSDVNRVLPVTVFVPFNDTSALNCCLLYEYRVDIYI